MTRIAVLLGIVVLGFATDASAQTAWRMDGYDGSRANRSDVAGPGSTPIPQTIATDVVGSLRRSTASGLLLTAGSDTITAYDDSGALRWRQTVPGITDVAVGPEGQIYASNATSLFAFTAAGLSLWTYVANNGNESSSLAVDSSGTVYFHSGSGFVGGLGERLSAIDANGVVKWVTSLQFGRGYTRVVLSVDESSAYLLQTKLVLGSPIGDAVRIDTTTGAVLGQTPCDPRGDLYAFTDSGALLAGTRDNDIMLLSKDLQTCSSIDTAPFVVGIATVLPDRLIAWTTDNQLVATDYLGTQLWISSVAFKTNAYNTYFQYASADRNGRLFAISADGQDVLAIDATDGTVSWDIPFGEAVTGVLVAADGSVYASAGGRLIRLSAQPACEPPSITRQPDSATVQAGESVTLQIDAVGSLPLSYQWYRGQSGDASDPISGATSDAYLLAAASATASYWVHVSNDCGSANSASATVVVTIPPPPPPPPPPADTLEVETPPLQRKQNLKGGKGNLWLGLRGVLSEQQVTPSFADDCYNNVVLPASLEISARRFKTIGLKTLADGIYTATGLVGGVPGHGFGKYLVSAALETFYRGADIYDVREWSQTAQVAAAKGLAGYLLTKAVSDRAGTVFDVVLTTKSIFDLLKEDDVEGDAATLPFATETVTARISYNPWSHYAVASLIATCSKTGYALIYEVNEHGAALDRINGVKALEVGQ